MKNASIGTDQLVRYFRKQYGDVILLDSQMKEHPSSKRTYIAADPVATLRCEDGKASLSENGEITDMGSDPWKALRDFRARYDDWMFGYFGYDLKNDLEDLVSNNPETASFPDLYMMVPGTLVESTNGGPFTPVKGEIPPDTELTSNEPGELLMGAIHHIDRESYLLMIRQALSSIREGEYYEINLSHVLEAEFRGDPFDLYLKMKQHAPVPFGSYMEIDGKSICCMSPERFLKKENTRLISQPIKGTIANTGRDEVPVLTESLLSEKNKAENLMIVDLVRNDLNRVSITGTVQVENLFEVQSFGTVHQMVSTILSETEPETDVLEIIKACFPMGSMTGAPKIAAMEAIERLENYRRGVYSGAIGYIRPDDDFDLNVVIRTALVDQNKLYYPVGGAITSDSVPEDEWEETLVKARALTGAI